MFVVISVVVLSIPFLSQCLPLSSRRACLFRRAMLSGAGHLIVTLNDDSGGAIVGKSRPAPIPKRLNPVSYSIQQREVHAQPGEVSKWAVQSSLIWKFDDRRSASNRGHESFVP